MTLTTVSFVYDQTIVAVKHLFMILALSITAVEKFDGISIAVAPLIILKGPGLKLV
jgi:hypothetical protein